jgi:hypothetical protein
MNDPESQQLGSPFKSIDEYGESTSPFIRAFTNAKKEEYETELTAVEEQIYEAAVNGDQRSVDRLKQRETSLKLLLDQLRP